MFIIFSRKIFISVLSFLVISVILYYFSWQKCKATGKILIKSYEINNKLISPNLSSEKNVIEKYNASSELPKIQLDPIVQLVIDKLKLENDKKEPLKVTDFSKNLKLKHIKNTDIILVSYRYSDQVLAQKIVNSLMEEYIKVVALKNKQSPTRIVDLNKNSIPSRRSDPAEIIQSAKYSCISL